MELASFPQWVQTSVLDVQRQNPTVMKVMIPVDVAIATSHFLLLSEHFCGYIFESNHWFARQNVLTEYWLRMKTDFLEEENLKIKNQEV